MEKRLHKLGIFSIKEVANFNPDLLKKELGVVDLDLFFLANGIDVKNVHQPYRPKTKGLGNSQSLPRDYVRQAELELVFREITEQVAIRLRRIRKKATRVSIGLRYSSRENQRPFQAQTTIEPANLSL